MSYLCRISKAYMIRINRASNVIENYTIGGTETLEYYEDSLEALDRYNVMCKTAEEQYELNKDREHMTFIQLYGCDSIDDGEHCNIYPDNIIRQCAISWKNGAVSKHSF